MNRYRALPAAVIVLAIMALFMLNLPTASAVPPGNDDFSSATQIGTLPFSDTVSLSETTTELGEPQSCDYLAGSVWYKFTPATTTTISADMEGSGAGNMLLNVYQTYGPTIYDLGFVDCASSGGAVTFNAQAGMTYYIQAGMTSCSYPPCTGTLQLNLQEISTPDNDDFANAAEITALPFNGSSNNTAATTEPGEPMWYCYYMPRTVWFKFTPAADTWVTIDMNGSAFYDTALTVYEAVSPGFGGLSYLDCTGFGGTLTLRLEGGKSYYFQAGDSWSGGGSFQLNISEITPPQPTVNFSYYPYDPSAFDTINFYDYSHDPGNVGIETLFWDFGDGTTATGWGPTHRFAADGEYTVQLTATTYDGRVGSATRLVSVSTHDVAIAKFLTPNTGKAGQTRQIVVGIHNSRYPETVIVELYRSTPYGYEYIGYQQLYVPVRSGNRTTDFQFSYTFTNEDAAIGSMNFRAIAYISDARDALSANNEAISGPVNVNP